MKKGFLLVASLALLGIGLVGVSCSKDDDDKGGAKWKGCRCSSTVEGIPFSIDFPAEEIKPITSCSVLQAGVNAELEEDGEDYRVTCKNL